MLNSLCCVPGTEAKVTPTRQLRHTYTHTLWVRTNAECELNVLESTRRVEAPAHPSGGVSILPRPNTSLLILTQIVERILMGLLCVHRKNSGIVSVPLYQRLCAESLCKVGCLITCCKHHSRCTVMLFAQTISQQPEIDLDLHVVADI